MNGETLSDTLRRVISRSGSTARGMVPALPFGASPWGRVDKVVWALAALLGAMLLLDPAQVLESLRFVAWALIVISPFLLLSVATAAAARATGSEQLIARVFNGQPRRMIVVAAVFGSLSPFCSCGVIPIVAGLLGAGVPLAPVMAFWLSSPLMDPEMFILSTATLGLPFTLGKTLAALGLGLMGGFATLGAQGLGLLRAPLSDGVGSGGCGTSSGTPAGDGGGTPGVLWAFWREPERNRRFAEAFGEAGWFLGKWLTLAFAVESLMVAYIPAEMVGQWLGGGAWWTIPAAVAVGVPAYLNGFAAIPLMAGLIEMGMAKGAAMAFMVAGGVTSLPAAMAVFALVRRRVFVWYIGLSLIGSLAAGTLFQLAVGA